MTKEEIEQAASDYAKVFDKRDYGVALSAFISGAKYAESENERLKAEREWISVDDRLPDSSTYIIAYKKNGLIVQLFYDMDKEFKYGQVYQTNQVTHWMPLPQPPKK